MIDRIASAIAKVLPSRVKYWVMIDVGSQNMGDDVVPEVPFLTVLERMAR